MPDNKNENNDSLFTQMFGLESEEPNVVEQPEVLDDVPEILSLKDNDEPIKQPEQRIIRSNNTTVNVNTFESNLNQLNKSTLTPQKSNNTQNNITTSTSKSFNDTIVLSSEPIKNKQEEPENKEVLEEVKFDPNAIPSGENNSTPMDFNEYPLDTETKSGIAKKILLILLCVVGLIGGWILLYNSVLAPKEEQNINNNDSNNKTEDEVKEDEETKEEVKKLEFDQTLSFYKGLVDNPEELYREYPFEPTESTGVILCEFINPLEDSETKINLNVYLYYENYLLKKSYIQQITDVKSKNNFLSLVSAATAIDNGYIDTESLTIDTKIDYNNQRITLGMFSNLAYGSYVNPGEGNIILKIKYDYDDNIKSGMAKVFGADDFIGNIKCSSVKTS
jgi:hypothetical protein